MGNKLYFSENIVQPPLVSLSPIIYSLTPVPPRTTPFSGPYLEIVVCLFYNRIACLPVSDVNICKRRGFVFGILLTAYLLVVDPGSTAANAGCVAKAQSTLPVPRDGDPTRHRLFGQVKSSEPRPFDALLLCLTGPTPISVPYKVRAANAIRPGASPKSTCGRGLVSLGVSRTPLI